jgi:hypothetical protein
VNTFREEASPFEEFIMGALIKGTQKTRARTTLDFRPSLSAVRLQIVLNGVTRSQTLAQTPQAAIQSEGNYEFQLTKQIEFDGEVVRTWSPAAFMTIHQRNIGAQTPVSSIPLLGPLASNIALGVADQRRPMTELIAAHRVTQSVAPEFNSRLDKELGELNRRYSQDAKPALSRIQLVPSDLSLISTEEAILIGAAFGQANPANASKDAVKTISRGPGGESKAIPIRQSLPTPMDALQFGLQDAPAPFSLDPTSVRDQALIFVHESLAEDLAARFHLGGLALPDSAIQRLLKKNTSASAAPQMYTLLFAKEKPLSLKFDHGEVQIILRVGIRPVVGPEFPMQAITIAVLPTLLPEQLQIHSEVRSIEPLQPADKLPEMTETVIRQAIEQKLQDLTLPRALTIPREGDKPGIPVTLRTLASAGGWLTVTFHAAPLPESPLAEGFNDNEVIR